MKTRMLSNRMLYIYVFSVLMFLLLALCGYYSMNKTGHFGRPTPLTQRFVTDMAYYDLPRMTLAVGQGSDETHVRIEISLEVAKNDLTVLQGYQPQITDRLNAFLGALRPEQMREADTLPWLRGEMLRQVNNLGAPVPVHALMLRQMVIM